MAPPPVEGVAVSGSAGAEVVVGCSDSGTLVGASAAESRERSAAVADGRVVDTGAAVVVGGAGAVVGPTTTEVRAPDSGAVSAAGVS